MDIYSILNFFKWQAKIRLPHGGLYERAFGEKPKVDEMLEKYIYFDDIYKSRILKYLFGSYLINEETLNEFYLFLQEYYYDEQSDCYKFNIGKKDLYLPVPQDEEKKVFKNELLDLIIPYLIGYPHIQNIPFHEGPYEKDNVCLKKGDIVLDCGANIGMFSAYASLKECSVFAFEPTEETYNKYLSKTIALNPGIHYIPKALYTKDGVQEFFLDKDNIGCNGMNISLKNIKSHSSEKIKVETTSIDSFVQENNLSKVDFIKADIEGSERFMLAGAKETLRRFQPNLSICYYHLLDDYKVLCNLIKSANSDYEIESDYKKIYAYVKK